MLRQEGERYFITDKGYCALDIYGNEDLSDKEKWILIYLLLLDYQGENNFSDFVNSVVRAAARLGQLGIDCTKFLSLLYEQRKNSDKNVLFKTIFWLLSFVYDNEFIDLFLKSSDFEKKELYDYVTSCSKDINTTDCIAKKYKNGGAYTGQMFNEDINIFLSTLILVTLQDSSLDNYLKLVSLIYPSVKYENLKSMIDKYNAIFTKVYDDTIIVINRKLGVDYMGIDKRLKDVEVALGFVKADESESSNNLADSDDINYDTCSREIGGENVILYGVPGAGKSWTIKNEYCGDDSKIERLVFHPDYTYSDFVGQILPKLDEKNQVTYVFTPGPFTNILKKAYLHPACKYYLVIEEVNRGNAPAIFGDIFQLLDRKVIDGSSEYSITNSDIAREVYGSEDHKVSIPSNLSILGTMNTSDQNVFTLDTAFQRRWSMRLIQNKFPEDGSEKDFANTKILDTDVTWEKFFTEINNLILSKNIRMTSSEDKRLGTHFISKEELILDTTLDDNGNLTKLAIRHNKKFAEKVLKYLWDDAFKFNKDEIFDLTKVNSLEKVIVEFTSVNGNERFGKILKQNIYDALIPKKTN